MDLKVLENLALIPSLIEEIKELKKLVAPELTTKKEVSLFLGVTGRTVNNYIEQGYLRENYHFKRKGVKILVFIDSAIREFKKEFRGVANEKVTI